MTGTALAPAPRLGMQAVYGLKEFWVSQDFTIRLWPGEMKSVHGAPQRYFALDADTALAHYQIGMSRRFLEERLPIVQWLGQPCIREATLA